MVNKKIKRKSANGPLVATLRYIPCRCRVQRVRQKTINQVSTKLDKRLGGCVWGQAPLFFPLSCSNPTSSTQTKFHVCLLVFQISLLASWTCHHHPKFFPIIKLHSILLSIKQSLNL